MVIAYFANYSSVSLSAIVYETLLRMGHQVFFFSPNVPKEGHGEINYCEPLVNVPETLVKFQLQPDLLLFVESSIHPLVFPIGLEKLTIPSCWWGIDNHMNYRWHKDYVHLFDHAFFAQRDYIERAVAYTKKGVHWLPLACNPLIHKDYGLDRIYDCTFVGNLNPRREKFFEKLKQQTPIQVFSGKSQLEMAHVYAQSKAAFNLAIREDLNMRVFETMASGAALITQDIKNGLTDLFEPGKHLLLHHVSNAGEVINKALKTPEKLSEIGRNGWKEVQENHTYEKRLTAIINIVLGLPKNESSPFNYFVSKGLVLKHRHFNKKDEANKAFVKAKELGTFSTLMRSLKSKLENSWFKLNVLRIKKY